MLKSRDIQLTLLMLMSLMGFGAISWLIQNAGERGSGWIGTGNFTQPILFLSGAVFAAFISSRAGAKDGSPERVLKPRGPEAEPLWNARWTGRFARER